MQQVDWRLDIGVIIIIIIIISSWCLIASRPVYLQLNNCKVQSMKIWGLFDHASYSWNNVKCQRDAIRYLMMYS